MYSNILRSIYRVISVSLLLACVSVGNADADDTTAVWSSATGSQTLFMDAISGKLASPEACQVGSKFRDFCSRWIGNKNGFAMQNVRVKTTDSSYFKEYSQCGDAYELRITKAKGSSVYVGTLKYIEKVFRTSDGRPVKPGSESFALAQEVPVTEFFMFKNGKWCY